MGRPIGSKNKQPYPKSEAVLRRLEDSKHFLNIRRHTKGWNHSDETKQRMSDLKNVLVSNGWKPHTHRTGRMAYQGKFSLTNPKKYVGNVDQVFYRSLWERTMMVRFDERSDVIEWSSEELRIPYRSPIDGKIHMYFPDFFCKYDTGRIEIIEVKPAKQCVEPIKPKRTTKKYINEITEYGRNLAKWDAARAICTDKGWHFVILTENEIYGKRPK